MTEERLQVAREVMGRFAERTGLLGERPPRRYLWTDAFAVCNFLALGQLSGRELAVRLVHRVPPRLGRHRSDDTRSGWLSGLDDFMVPPVRWTRSAARRQTV